MTRASRMTLAIFLIVISLVSVDEVHADPLVPLSFDNSEWRVAFGPYVFGTISVDGDSTVAGQTAAIDLDLSDILDALEFVLSGRLEVWKGDIGFILDGYYVNLEGSGGTTKTLGPLPINADVDVGFEQFFVDALGSYRLINQPYNADGDRWSLDINGGIRYNYLKQEIDLDVRTPIGPGRTRSLGGSDNWIDPMVGARVALGLNERWTAVVRGDIGGLGFSDTDLTWSVTGGFDYRPWETTSLKFGWRAYSIDYASILSDGAFAFDV